MSCPLPPAVELIGEKWAFLILRGAFNGLQHFEEFQAGLGIARNILSDRLAKLVAGGILERAPDPDDGRRVIYSLTPKGEELLPGRAGAAPVGRANGAMASMQVVLADRRDGKPVRKICVQAHDGRELKLGDLTWIDARRRAIAAPDRRRISLIPWRGRDRAARARRAARCAAPCCSPPC